MMTLLLLAACADEPPAPACASFPDSPSAPATVLSNEDDCGFWSLAMDEQLIVSVYVTVPEAPCSDEVGDGLELPSTPIYTNMSDDASKWTYQFFAVAAADSAEIAITCDEGTTWNGRVRIE